MSDTVIIVRKKRRKKKEAPHGAWKVAFADLMVCMMSFFLVLWVLQVINSEDKEKLINFFKDGNVTMPSHGHGLGNSINPIQLPQVATSRIDKRLDYVMEESSLIEGEFNSDIELEYLAKKLRESLKLLDEYNSVLVEVTPQGIKLTIADSDKGNMFSRGGAQITPYYEDLLFNLAPLLKTIKNSLIITGHTDSVKFVGRTDTNWSLSSKRANVVRNTLVESGLNPAHIFQVTGMADTALLNEADPESSINRRVELFILTRAAKEMLSSVYKSDKNLTDEYQQDYSAKHEFAAEKAKENQLIGSFKASVIYD